MLNPRQALFVGRVSLVCCELLILRVVCCWAFLTFSSVHRPCQTLAVHHISHCHVSDRPRELLKLIYALHIERPGP